MVMVSAIYTTQSNSSKQKHPNKSSFFGPLGYKNIMKALVINNLKWLKDLVVRKQLMPTRLNMIIHIWEEEIKMLFFFNFYFSCKNLCIRFYSNKCNYE